MALSNEDICLKIDQFGFSDISQLFTVQDTYLLYEPEVMRSVQNGFKLSSIPISTFRDKIISVEYEDYVFPVMTNVNSVTFDSAGQFGSAAKFNGTNQSLSVAHRANMKFGTKNFTIEAFVKINTYAGIRQILGVGADSGAYGVYALGLGTEATWGTGFRLNFLHRNGANNALVNYPSDEILQANFPLDTWHHVAVVKSGTDLYLFVNGIRIKTFTGIDSAINFNQTAGDIRVGARNLASGTISQWFSGSIDELRVSCGDGVAGARYLGSTYAVPTVPFTSDASTVMLLHLNGNLNDNYANEIKYFIQEEDDVFYYNAGVKTLLTSDANSLTNNEFSQIGNDLNQIPFNTLTREILLLIWAVDAQNLLLRLPPYKLIQQLYEPELYVLSEVDSIECDLQTTNIYWQISPNGEDWYVYNFVYGKWYIPKFDYTGLTSSDVESLNFNDLLKLIPKDGTLHLKAILNTHNSTKTPNINAVLYTLGTYYNIGNCYVYTQENQMEIHSWEYITGVEVIESKPAGSEIFYAVSIDNRVTWQYWKNNKWNIVSLNNLFREGMSKVLFEASDLQALNKDDSTMLDVAFCLVSTNYQESPTVTSIKFTHIDTPAVQSSNFVRVPVPDEGFRNVLVDDEYELRLVDGFAFNEPPLRYDLYTTPKGVKLRPLDAGTLVGGVESDIYPFEVINGYSDVDCNIVLTVRFADQEATQDGLGARLPDTDIDRFKTYVEMSRTQAPWSPQYPIKFRLNREQSTIVFIRIMAKLVGEGIDTFQVRLVAEKV